MSINSRVVVAPLGRRFAAWLVDRIVPTTLVVAFVLVTSVGMPDTRLVYDVVLVVVLMAWVMVQWWAYATRGAGLGYRVTGLQLVRLGDGRPLGWGRMCLRTLILQSASALVIPGVILAIMLVIQERRQGWMDLAVGSVAVRRQPRVAAEPPAPSRPMAARQVVGLPAHLTQPGFVEPSPAPTTMVTEVPVTSAPVEPIRQVPRAVGSHVIPGSAPVQQVPGPAVVQQPVMPAEVVSQPRVVSGSGVPQQPVVPAPVRATSSGPLASFLSPATQPVGDQPRTSPAQPISSVPTTPAQPPVPPAGGASFGAAQRVASAPVSEGVSRDAAVLRMRPRQVADEFEEGTRLVAGTSSRGGAEGWFIRLDDGRQVPLTRTLLLGRDPAPRPTDPDVELVAAGEPSSTVSRTHLALGVDHRGVFLVDRGSTNGTAVRGPNGELQPCPAETMVRLAEGQVVSFGERRFQLIRVHAGS